MACMCYADGSLAEVTSSVIHHGEEQGIVLQCADAKLSAPWDVKAETGQANGFPKPGGNAVRFYAKKISVENFADEAISLGNDGEK
ncbi:MAG TPA: hypothetical protein H9700_09470 [Candidatus Eisenbergiella intestinipullorum]|nr:hypothetical protein [Candidatus Eisenbergiella intestinipullorum]